VFENDAEADLWIQVEFKLHLKKQYKFLTHKKETLPGLKIGDECNVHGESTDVFKITGMVKYSDHRYGFKLDNGTTEEVAKCHINLMKETLPDDATEQNTEIVDPIGVLLT